MLNNNIKILVIVLFITVIVTVELLFGFSGKLMKNYKETFEASNLLEAAASEGETSEQTASTELINSLRPSQDRPIKVIISKVYGKSINIESIGRLPTSKFILKINGECLSVNSDGTYGLGICNRNSLQQHWNLIYITNERELTQAIPQNNRNRGASLSSVQYPFFMCVSAYNTNMCLQYDGGYINVLPIGNYDNQKWDVDYFEVDYDVKTHESNIGPYPLNHSNFSGMSNNRNSGELDIDPNRIKINLKLNKEILDQLSNDDSSVLSLGSGSGTGVRSRTANNSEDNSSMSIANMINSSNPNPNRYVPTQSAEQSVSERIEMGTCNRNDWLPKNSVRSLCKGCDADLI